MKRSESIIEISKALYQLHKSIGKAQKDAKNPFFNSKYSTLESVSEVAKEPLDANGLFITQTVISDDKSPVVETTVIHAETGEYITSAVPVFMNKMDMQGFGSAITYARRYGLAAILGIVQEDDDGNGTVPPNKDKAPEKEPEPQELSDGSSFLEKIKDINSKDDLVKAVKYVEDNKHSLHPSAYDKIMKEFDGKEIELSGEK